MSNPIWLNDPTILLDKSQITEIWPNKNMCSNRKINAITRLVIILTVIGYLITGSVKIIFSGIITIILLIILSKSEYFSNIKNIIGSKEAFTNNIINSDDFTNPTKDNPMMNILLPEINGNPNRSVAAPSFNREVMNNINNITQEQIITNNDLDPKLFKDLGDQLEFDQSMRNFYTTPITTVPNDQTSFAEFCYGNMPSCKEDYQQCSKNQARLGPITQ